MLRLGRVSTRIWFASLLCVLTLAGCSSPPAPDPANRLPQPIRTTVTYLGASGVLQVRTYRTTDHGSGDFLDPEPLARLRAVARTGAEVAYRDHAARFNGGEAFRHFVRRSDGLVVPGALTPLGPVAPLEAHWPPFDPGFGGPGFLTQGAFHMGARTFAMAVRDERCTDGCLFEDRWRAAGTTASLARPEVVTRALKGCVFVVRYIVCDVPPDVFAFVIEDQLGDARSFFIIFDLAVIPSEQDPQRCLNMRITDQRKFADYSDVDVNSGACMERIRDLVFRSRSERPPVVAPGLTLTDEG
jgi:hypothetical protein